ncbi:Gluconokinase [Rubellimicrobium mesophilum DSM 19309]|uniref:Gluconokinase n=1 Tax=Rubellimicrobium mesophilum DSM 19309 TaxID=442562 RepID=A0A017HLY0_9RHOB|nr:gluconokinase [Rubellimicrobium mesophilum]EYD75366.1 Gluconokinase [Rubellimicrobium mesophilum DSM 19309]
MDGGTGRFVVMGVSGVGKTGTGTRLAQALGGRFVEGDDLHTAEARAKMAGGTPLTDEDRWPWLDRVGAALAEGEPPVVAACSALKRRYRDRLRASVPGLVFLHLVAERELVLKRLQRRKGHYMPPSLLDSQIEALEPLGADERGLRVSVEGPKEEVLQGLLRDLERL